MPDWDLSVARYLRLADIAQLKGQLNGRNRFLLLAALDACHAGLLSVATLCRDRVLRDEPRHLIRRFPTIPDAIRSEDFQPFARRLARFCSREQAEHLLKDQTTPDFHEDAWESLPEFAKWLMEQPHWTAAGAGPDPVKGA